MTRRLTRHLPLMLMAVCALAFLTARPAAAQAPDTAVAEDTTLMLWIDLTRIDDAMIERAGEMMADLADSPMAGGLPVGDLDLGILMMQDFRESFVAAGGEGLLVMMGMPDMANLQQGMKGLPLSVMVKTGERADPAALKDAMTDLMGEAAGDVAFEMDEYADGWLAVSVDGLPPVTKEGDADAADRFNAQLIERAEAPVTVVLRMNDQMREVLDGMMLVDDPTMAMMAGMMQPLHGMDVTAVSLFTDGEETEIDIAMVFEDKRMGSQFLNSFNGMLMLGQGMLGAQMAEMNNPPSQEAIAGFFQFLALKSTDGGETLRLILDQRFFDAAEEMLPALQDMMGGMGGEGQLF